MPHTVSTLHYIPTISLKIQSGNGDVTITNDGATILKQMQVFHPAAKMVSNSEILYVI